MASQEKPVSRQAAIPPRGAAAPENSEPGAPRDLHSPVLSVISVVKSGLSPSCAPSSKESPALPSTIENEITGRIDHGSSSCSRRGGHTIEDMTGLATKIVNLRLFETTPAP